MPMWGVANLLAFMPWTRRCHLEAALASSRDALERLEHDHTARYLVCRLCEAALRLNRLPVFRDAVQRYRSYLSSEITEGEFMPRQHAYLVKVIPLFDQLLGLAPGGDAQPMNQAVLPYLSRGYPLWLVSRWVAILRLTQPMHRWLAIALRGWLLQR